jgi:hypothetical protein
MNDASMERERKIQRALQKLNEFRSDVRESDAAELDLLKLERQLREVLEAVGRECIAEILERADTRVPIIEVDGERWGNRRESRYEYTSSFGDVEVVRSIYSRAGGGRVVVPLDRRLGIVERRYTPQLARVMTHAVAVMTSSEAEQFLLEAGVAMVSRSTLHRVPQAIAARYEINRQSLEAALREEDEIPEGATVVQVALDGVMVPQDGEHVKRRGRRSERAEPARHERRYGELTPEAPANDDDRAGRSWHEAFVATLAFWDGRQEPMQPLRTIYMGRMPETNHETISLWLEEELRSVLAERPDLDVTFASDGDALQWQHLEGIEAGLPPHSERRTTFNLDFWHALSYVHRAANAAHGEGTAEAKVQAEQWRETLRQYDDGAARVLKSMRYFRSQAADAASRDELQVAIGYLAHQSAEGRMQYKRSLDYRHPIGTGAVEAAAKTLVNVRMKRAGARYSQHGGQTLLTFRAALLSERFDSLWTHLRESYRAPVRVAA